MSSFSRNPFALLSDSDDEASSAPAPAVVPTPKVIPGQAKKPTNAAPAKQQQQQQGQQQRRSNNSQAANSNSNNSFSQSREDGGALGSDGRDDRAERRTRGGSGRGGPRGGAGRGRGGGRGGAGAGGKIERPDRHSQTGVHDTDKKVASGWGADEGKQELQAENDGWGDAAAETGAETAAVNGAAPTEDAAAVQSKPAQPEEEEDKTKTFEEYLAERAGVMSVNPTLQARKANEGADDAQWKDGVELVRAAGNGDEDWFMGSKEAKKVVSKKQNKGKVLLEVEPAAYRPPRSDRGAPRGGAGGRGRGEGGRGRGGGDRGGRDAPRGGSFHGGAGGRNGGRGGSREFNAEDANAFPSLS